MVEVGAEVSRLQLAVNEAHDAPSSFMLAALCKGTKSPLLLLGVRATSDLLRGKNYFGMADE
jgi:hypothetical protein